MNKENENLWPCIVCGHFSFDGPPGTYEICQVCGWEDDGVQSKHPRMRGGANGGSVFDYQQSYKEWYLDPENRDPGCRPLGQQEAAMDDGSEGKLDYSLDYYKGKEPYYWRS